MFLLYSPTLPPLPYCSFFRNLLPLFRVKEGHVYLRLQMSWLTREILVEELLLIIFQLIY